MNEKEQLEWCERNHATVWFTRSYVRVKVNDFNTIKGESLQEAISRIEKFRQYRTWAAEEQEARERDKKPGDSYDFDR